MMFDKVVHVDCSLWQSMRALQKAIAEELELPESVMAIFDQHDDEDDFNGIDQGSRGVILDIREEIFRKLVNSTFVVIFHNGSGHYINLYECGVPLTEFFGNKVLWTWGRRFRLYGELEDDNFENIKADVLMGVFEWKAHVLHDEATEVAKYMGILEPDTILECFKYVWERRRFGHIDWGRHASNYWVCDGIIQGKDNASASASAWEVGDALQRNINLDWIFEKHIPNANGGMIDRWVSATHKALVHGDIGVLPPRATSFFLLADKSKARRVILPVGMFPDNNSLRVLHLSWCSFSFTSPPFLCCNHLRFLLLEHCADDVREEDHESNNHNGSCLQNLWVLDLRYTYWYSKKIMCLMNELRELNVEGVKDWMSIVDIFGGRTSLLVKLRVTTDKDSATEIAMQRPALNMSRAIHLKTIILDNCVGLEQVIPSVLPPFLESFSFIIGGDAVVAKICSISFRGLAKLKSVLLRGLMGCLEELDLSGTAVKTLDLNEVVALNLKRLFLLGCEKLRAIKWPPIDKQPWRLEVLHIDTIRSASSVQANLEEKGRETTGSSCIIGVDVIKPTTTSFAGYISLRDARLLRSLVPVDEYFKYKGGHMEIGCSSPAASSDAVGGSKCAQGIRKPVHCLYARDVIFQDYLRALATTNEGVIRWMWPALPVDESKGWYVHLQDEEGRESGLQQGSTQGTSSGADLIPKFICNNAKKLHVHDSFSITSIPFPLVVAHFKYIFFRSRDYKWLSWYRLERCQVERCPKLSSVFATPTPIDDESHEDGRFQCFSQLTTFWASELPMARYIWKWSTIWLPSEMSFGRLNFVHLDYCPRLIHVLPLTKHMNTLPRLETLEIVCCGDLMEIFPLDHQRQEKQTNFPKLKRIHLHDLPKLQRICGSKMLAPELETIKIRGCWSLRRLPAGANQCPEVDCEKDWWDNLEWDEGDANHHPSLYKPTHSRYYKKAQLPRGTVLR